MKQLAKKIVLLLVLGVLAAAFGPRGGEAREVQLLMALDISGSMKVTDPLRLLPKSAQIMVQLLDEKDSLGVLTFEDVTQTRLPCAALSPPPATQRISGTIPSPTPGPVYGSFSSSGRRLEVFRPPGEGQTGPSPDLRWADGHRSR